MFQIGDRVVVLRDYATWDTAARCGTVLEVRMDEPCIGISFDGWSRGHNLGNRLTDRSGLWVPSDTVVLEKPRERVKRGFAKAVLRWEETDA